MNQKKHILILLFVMVLSQFSFAVQKKNLLLITIDTLRPDRLSYYSKKYVSTPNIDKIARQGIVFTRAFAHNPITLASHANILTGTTPLYHGVSDNNRFKLDKKFLTIAEYLKDFNYQTGAVVASFVLSRTFGLDQGFDYYEEPVKKNEFIAREVVDRAVKWLKNKKQANWFLWLHFWDPHSPYSPPGDFSNQFKHDKYSGEVAYLDFVLGDFFTFLQKGKYLDNCLLIMTGDHGESLGEHGEREHGYFAYNATLHIPLILYQKGNKAAKINNNVSHIDIFPTICEILAIPRPRHLHGESLLDSGKKKDRKIYFESKAPFLSKGWAPLEGFISGYKKFINLPIKELYFLNNDFDEKKNKISQQPLNKLLQELSSLKARLSGEDRNLSKYKLDQKAAQKLRTFGYLTGFKQKRKTIYSREDDLKVLMPLQNKLRQARELMDAGKLLPALGLFKSVIEKRPDNIGSYIHAAQIYEKLNQPQKSLEFLEQGEKVAPENIELKSRIGIALVKLNKFDRAITILEALVKKEDFNAETWNFLGTAYLKKGLYQQALSSFNQAALLNPEYSLVFNNIGTLYLQRFLKSRNREFFALAVKNFNQALKINPRLPSTLNGLGAAYSFINERKKAVFYWKQALEYKPDFINVYFNLSLTLIKMGKTQQAKSCLIFCKEKYFDRLNPRDQRYLEKLLSGLN